MRNYLFRISATIILQLMLLPALTATSFSFRKYTCQNGLPSDKVLCVNQDQSGRIWIGTTRGVACFDGTEFHIYSKQQQGIRHLSHNYAQSILTRENGDVWIATSDSLNVYDYKNDCIKIIDKTSGLTFNDITTLAHGQDCIWIGTFGGGLFRFDNHTEQIEAIEIVNSQQGTEQIMAICEDSNRQLWVGTRYNGVYLYSPHTQECRRLMGKGENTFVNAIYQDLSGTIWVGTSTGFYYIERNTLIEIEAKEFKGKSVFSITEQPAGTIWVAGEEIFLNFKSDDFMFSADGEYSFLQSHHISKDINTLKGIHSIITDNQNNIWLGTYGEGVNVLISNDNFEYILPITTLPLGNTPTTIYDIQTLDNGELLLTKEGSGIISYDPVTKLVKASQTSKDNLTLAIYKDDKGNLWEGGNRNGLILHKKESYIPKSFGNEIGVQVRKIFQTSDHSLYISGNEGLLRTRDEGETWTNILEKWFPRNPDVRCVAETPEGKLWFGTYNTGLMCYDPKKDELVQLSTANGLRSNIIYDLYREKDTLWIATDEGLSTYSLSHQQFNNIYPSKELEGVTIFAIQKDRNKDLWFSTSDGIIHYQRKRHELKTYSFKGLPPVGEFSEGCSAIDTAGTIYFGGLNGILCIHPNEGKPHQELNSNLLFTKFLLFDQPISPNDRQIKNNPLTENINIQRSFQLNAAQKMFTFHFSTPYYVSEPTYAYRLQGIDREWTELGSQNWVTFRNPDPGKYTLQVRAFVPDYEIPIESSLELKINPPVWLTWWAKITYAIVISMIIIFLWLQFKAKLDLSHKIELEKTNRRKDEEIHEAKLIFFTNISHELRTPLTLLIAPLDQLIANEANPIKQKTLKLISRNANRLLVLVNQILDFRKSEKGEMQLQVHEAEVAEWSVDIIQSFNEIAEEKNIVLTTRCQTIENKIWFDTVLMEKVCFNLLSNAIKFTSSQGKVCFSVQADDEWLIIKVTDNGVGIKQEMTEKVFDRFFQEHQTPGSSAKQPGTGIGLHLVKSIVELHHGTITLSSDPGIETTFTVVIPCNKESYESHEIRSGEPVIKDLIESTEQASDEIIPSFTNGQRPQVLVVEDNDELREYLRDTLSERFNVEICENGQEAIEKAHEMEIDLIVCDVMMPVMDGYEVCRTLKKDIETNYIPIILLTAKSGFDDMIQGLEEGADAYLTKPFNINHLIAQMNRILENRAILRKKYADPMHQLLQKRKEGIEGKFMDEITQLILNNLSDEELNGNLLAGYLHMSRTSLHRKLKSVTGISAGDLIKNVRLSKAAEELISTDKTISEISYSTGFSSPSYFSLCFTNYFGKSPKAYRAENEVC